MAEPQFSSDRQDITTLSHVNFWVEESNGATAVSRAREVVIAHPLSFVLNFTVNSIIIADQPLGGSPGSPSKKRVTCYMQFLPGASALSVFKQAKLLVSLQKICPELLAICALYPPIR